MYPSISLEQILLVHMFTFFTNIFSVFYFQCPEHGVNRLNDRLLLFRHDYSSPNILHHISSASEIEDEVLVEIVLSGKGYDFSRCLKMFHSNCGVHIFCTKCFNF